MEETISLKEVFQIIRKRLLLIIAVIVATALIAAAVSYYVLTPKYVSNSQFIVNQSKKDQDSEYDVNNLRSNVEIINTYKVIIRSPRILDEVVDELNLPYTSGALRNKIQVSSEENSQVVTVTVTDTNQAMATDIANATVETFQKNIPDIMNVDNVKILSVAENPDYPSPVEPNPQLNIAIGLALGAMIGVGIAFLLEYLNNTIRSEEMVEKELELPTLGIISHMNKKNLRKVNMSMKHSQKGKDELYAQKETV